MNTFNFHYQAKLLLRTCCLTKKIVQVSGMILIIVVSAKVQAASGPIRGINNPNRIPGQYIVVLKPNLVAAQDASVAAQSIAMQSGFHVTHRFRSVFSGFAMDSTMVATQAVSLKQLSSLLKNPDVDFIEADQHIELDTSSAIYPQTTQALIAGNLWGLDRINQRKLPLDKAYSFNATGKNVHAYIIDSGINLSHQEFAGRILNGADFVKDGEGVNDCRGHGSHVAGILGGTTYGVAKDVSLHPVRVFGCNSGSEFSVVISAIEWVLDNRKTPALINMSMGGRHSDALNQAVDKAVAANVAVIVSAGNDAEDACKFSPADAAGVIAAGSSDESDVRSPFSNIGKCIAIFAPGSDITSAWIPDSEAKTLLSGTSMATPYVAGVVARYLEKNPAAQPAEVSKALLNGGTKDVLSDVGAGSPNLLLNSDIDADSAWQRTIIFVYGQTEPGQDMFIRGGIDHGYAEKQLSLQCSKENMLCAIPLRHLNLRNATTAPWKNNDRYLDWYGVELHQDTRSEGSALDWTTNSWPSAWGRTPTVEKDGYGETPLNAWGAHYWMLDVEMDCTKTVKGWFELKSYISNGPGWESDVVQPGAPYYSHNHFAQCGKINVFERGQHTPVAISNF
ncbi:MAG TPA: S8 family serine peptidase [Cellvibrio sp.]|nr:S8 family serine peptidase [Cellvibrio sp.]